LRTLAGRRAFELWPLILTLSLAACSSSSSPPVGQLDATASDTGSSNEADGAMPSPESGTPESEAGNQPPDSSTTRDAALDAADGESTFADAEASTLDGDASGCVDCGGISCCAPQYCLGGSCGGPTK
jgi:hypothetical protein